MDIPMKKWQQSKGIQWKQKVGVYSQTPYP